MLEDLHDSVQAAKSLWDKVLERSSAHKATVYGNSAENNKKFYGKPQDFMYQAQYYGPEGIPQSRVGPGGYIKGVRFRASSNLVFNMVEVYLPALYARDPVRKCSPRRVDIPDDLIEWLQQAAMAQQQQQIAMQAAQMGLPYQPPPPPVPPGHDMAMDAPQQRPLSPEDAVKQLRAKLVEWALNQLIRLNGLKGESRAGIVEGLVCGRGILAVELRETDGVTLPGSFQISEQDLFVDPDVKRLSDAKWIAIRRCKPVWELEDEWGYPRGTLQGDYKSYGSESVQAATSTHYDRTKVGGTCDMIEYYEVFSRMGVGDLLQGAAPEFSETLGPIGKHVRLIIHSGSDFPINLPEFLFDPELNPMEPEQLMAEIAARTEWPVPTWKRPKGNNPWPIAELDFHENPEESWPIAHCTPVMSMLESINWVYSYMMGRVQIASRVFPVVPKELDEDIKQTILHGDDMELIELQMTPGMREQLVEFLTIPDASKDLWTLLAAMIHEFEKATGVSELQLTGQTPQQMRSAAEAQVKQSAMSVRPEDMANAVQDWMTRAAENEAFALLHCAGIQDIAQLFGEQYQEGQEIDQLSGAVGPPQMGPYTSMWNELILQQDSSEVMNALEFEIESGSAQKKNKEQQQALAQQSMQMLFQPIFGYYMKSGDPTQLNAIIRAWATANDHPTPDQLMFPDMRQQIAQQQQMAQQQAMAQQAAQHGPEGPQHEQQPQQPQPQGPSHGAPVPPMLAAMLGHQPA